MRVVHALVLVLFGTGLLPVHAAPVATRGTVELTRAVKADFDLEGRGREFQAAPGLRCQWSKRSGAKTVFEYAEKIQDGRRLLVPGGTRLEVTGVFEDRASGAIELRFRSSESVLTKLRCKGGTESVDQVFGFRSREKGEREVAATGR